MTILSRGESLKPGTIAGDLLTIPVGFNEYTASRVATLDDIGRLALMNSGSANTFTIPSDAVLASSGGQQQAFSPGQLFAVCQYGAGQTTLVAGTGVTLNSFDSLLATEGQFAVVMAMNVRPNEWLVFGRLA
jgi:hypothetical protein